MILTKDLTFSYGGRSIIDSLSIDFKDSTFVGIIGPNGSGKTTLLKLIAGLNQSQRGSIYIADLSSLNQKHHDVMWLPSRLEMPFAYTVYDILQMLLHPWERLSQFSSKDLAIAASLEEVGLTCGQERIFNSLSAGEQHRAMIGAAIVSDAKLLLLDEPCANLDIGASHRILRKLSSLGTKGKKVLLSIHDLQLAYQYCDKFLLLSGKKEVLFGSREIVFQSTLLATSFGVQPSFVSTDAGTIPIFSDLQD